MEELHARIDGLHADGARRILGLTGAPGAGKSTLARTLYAFAPDRTVIVPMDGFHLANSELRRLGRSGRKGAEDTFDSAGYVALLARLRNQVAGESIYAPEFRREIEESIAGAIPVMVHDRLVITEGNYLLLQTGHWAGVRALVDEVWYVDIDPQLRTQRLVARHVQFGRDEERARSWVASTDEPNAVMIEATRSRADVVVCLAPAPGETQGVI